MNNNQREQISSIANKLHECCLDLESVRDDEDYTRENMPSSLQNNDSYQDSETCSYIISDAIDSINQAAGDLESIIDK